MANLVASFSPGTLRANFSGTVGFHFQLTVNQTFNQIGMMGGSGTTGVRNVYIAQSGVGTLVTASIDLTGVPQGTWTYVSISPTTLTSGITYGLFAAVVSDSVQNWADSAPTTLNNSTVFASAFSGSNPPTGSWSPQTSGQQYFGVDLGFSIPLSSASFAGAGTLAANATKLSAGSAAGFIGAGTLTAKAARLDGASANFTGAGILTASATKVSLVSTAAFSGVGTLSAVATGGSAGPPPAKAASLLVGL